MLYTRKGDDGTTKTFEAGPGERMSKGSLRAETLGALDEVNSFLGLCKVEAKKWNYKLEDGSRRTKTTTLHDIVHDLQEGLFLVQAEVAGSDKNIPKSRVSRIEKWTNAMEEEMPPIKSFFISGGMELAARFDVARTLARRAERISVRLHESGERKLKKHTRSYLNRLSSVLYALARYSNHSFGASEKPPSYR